MWCQWVRSASSASPMSWIRPSNPSQPLQWQAWLLRQVTSLSNVQVPCRCECRVPSSPVTGGANQRAAALSAKLLLGLEGTVRHSRF